MTGEELHAHRIAVLAYSRDQTVMEAAHALGWAAPSQHLLERADEVLDVFRRPYEVVITAHMHIGDVDTPCGEVHVRFGDEKLSVDEMGQVLAQVREQTIEALRRGGAV